MPASRLSGSPPAAESDRLFAYGTLMFPEVWELVTGAEFRAERAELRGYRIFRVDGADFPGIIRTGSDSDFVPGIVFTGLSANVLRKLDAYEDTFYRRQEVTVDGSGSCFAYVVPEEARSILSDEIWRADDFERQGLADFVRRLRGG